METDRAYEIFVKMITEDNIYLIPTLTFRKLCVSLDTDFKSLDDMVFAELGMTGEEVLISLREAAPRRLCEKYMLKGFIL